MTISYLDHYLIFCNPAALGGRQVPKGYKEMNDDDLDACFLSLQQGRDVFVWNNHGTRYLASYLFSHYQYVKAAGGIVTAPDGDSLLIFREGRWDIPKGMVEKNEQIEHAAIREVQEETGLMDITLGSLIAKTYHIYDKYGGWHLKQTSWYRMTTQQKVSTNPQLEEGITQAVWLTHQDCIDKLSHSFASLRTLSTLI